MLECPALGRVRLRRADIVEVHATERPAAWWGRGVVADARSVFVCDLSAWRPVRGIGSPRLYPAWVDRLADGSWLVSVQNYRAVRQMDSSGPDNLWSVELGGTPRSAQRARDGRTLVVLDGQAVLLDAAGQSLWQHEQRRAVSAFFLEDGRIAVGLAGGLEILDWGGTLERRVEFERVAVMRWKPAPGGGIVGVAQREIVIADPDGQVRHRIRDLQNVRDAVLLPNGVLVVARDESDTGAIMEERTAAGALLRVVRWEGEGGPPGFIGWY
jgi:hypothetical protein